MAPFEFGGQTYQVDKAFLAPTCVQAAAKAGGASDVLQIFLPSGNCVVLVINLPDLTNFSDVTEMERPIDSVLVDQDGAKSQQKPFISVSMGSGSEVSQMQMYYSVKPTGKTFTWILPDGQEITIIPTEPTPQPTLLPAEPPLPTFTPLADPEAYYQLTPQAAERKFIDEHGIKMVFIPAGEFQMGRSEAQSKTACKQLKGFCFSFWDMAPEHTVTLDDFYMDVLEVTNAHYAACVAAGACVPPVESQSATRSSYFGNPEFDDYPVINVDWQMARTYCQWRNADLPTEAQWEKAARGTDDRWFPWGDVLDGKHANFNDANNSSDGGRKDLDDGYADTAPVNSYPEGASPYGILNLAGNVSEWVLDEYSALFYEESPGNNPIGTNLTGLRVIRGGSWGGYEVYTLWVSSRYRSHLLSWDYSTGFRCARSP